MGQEQLNLSSITHLNQFEPPVSVPLVTSIPTPLYLLPFIQYRHCGEAVGPLTVPRMAYSSHTRNPETNLSLISTPQECAHTHTYI